MKIQNGPIFFFFFFFFFLAVEIFLKIAEYPYFENINEIVPSRTVKEIEANLCFASFGKNSKIQNGRHFWGGEIFLKIAKSTLLSYPVG